MNLTKEKKEVKKKEIFFYEGEENSLVFKIEYEQVINLGKGVSLVVINSSLRFLIYSDLTKNSIRIEKKHGEEKRTELEGVYASIF